MSDDAMAAFGAAGDFACGETSGSTSDLLAVAAGAGRCDFFFGVAPSSATGFFLDFTSAPTEGTTANPSKPASSPNNVRLMLTKPLLPLEVFSTAFSCFAAFMEPPDSRT
ncbi:MAG: hypothetical protein ABI318_23180 [Chthoniobacteraceae bacterium]